MFINQDFQNGITQLAPSVVFRLTFDDITISNENYLIKADLEFICDSFVGELPSWKLGATFLYDDAVSYINRELFLEIGVYDSTHTAITWMPFKSFIVSEDGQQTDEINKQITITAFDYVSKLDVHYQTLIFPMTGRQILETLLGRNGVALSANSPTMYLDDFLFTSLNIGEGSPISDRTVIANYLMINLCFGFADRQDNLKVVDIFETSPIQDGDINFSFDTFGFKLEKENGPINALVYGNRAVGADESYQDIFAKDNQSIEENGLTELKIFDNVFMDLLPNETKQEIVNQLFTKINGFKYNPFDLDMFARPDFDPGDIIQLTNSENELFNIPLTGMTFTYTGGLTGKLTTKKLPESLTNYYFAGANQKSIETEIRVNKAEGEIALLVQQQDVLDESLSQLTITVNDIQLIVSTMGYPNMWMNSSGITGLDGYTFESVPIDMRTDFDQDMVIGTNYDMRLVNDPIMKVIDINNIAGTGFEFYFNGKAFSRMNQVTGGKEYFLRTYSMGVSKKFDINAIEFDVDGEEIKRTKLLSLPDYDAFNMSQTSITLNEDTEFIQFYFDVELEELDRYIVTRTMFTLNSPQEYSVSMDEVIFFAQSGINALRGELNLYAKQSSLDETNQVVEHNTSNIDLMGSRIELKAEQIIVDGIEQSIRSAILNIDAATGITAIGEGFTLKDNDGDVKVFFDTTTNEYIFNGKVMATGAKSIITIDGGNLNVNDLYGNNLASLIFDDAVNSPTPGMVPSIGFVNQGRNGFRVSNTSEYYDYNFFVSWDRMYYMGSKGRPYFSLEPDNFLLALRSNYSSIELDERVNNRIAFFLKDNGAFMFNNFALQPNSSERLGLPNKRWYGIYLDTPPDISSTRKIKEDVEDVDISIINSLNPITYKMIGAEDRRLHMGFIAEDVYDSTEGKYYFSNEESISYTELIAPIVKYIQELNARIEKMEEKA